MRNIYIVIVLFVGMISFSGCAEDEGNYDYDWVAQASISSLNNTATTFQIGDAMVLRPTVSFSRNGEEATALEDVFSEDEYEFYWIARRYVKSLGEIVSDTIGRERNLNYIVDLAPDKYLLEYQVCNKSRSVQWLARLEITVTLSVSEGWLFLEDDNGQAELSAYARAGDGKMHMVRNLLASSGIPSSALAGPRQVVSTYQNQKGNGVWIITDHFTGFLNVKEGHRWNDRQVIGNYMVEMVGNDFVFDQMSPLMFYTFVGFADDGVRVSNYPEMLFTADVLPTPANGRFEVAPYACAIGYDILNRQILFFDTTNKRFRVLDASAGAYNWFDADAKFPEGFDLMTMQKVGDVGAERICCLLRKDDEVYKLLASTVTTVDMEAKPISNSEKFLKAEQIAFHQFLFLPYYLYENKIYVNRDELGDREIEIWRTPESDEEVEEGETGIRAELEGKITCVNTQVFTDISLAQNEYRRVFMNYLIVATELPDGTGKVYFLTPEQSNAYKLTISDVVVTDHKVVSIDYQKSDILKY